MTGGLKADVVVDQGAFRLVAGLAIEPGETVAVLGPNGAGKSTLVAALAGFVPLAAGRVVLAGRVWEDTQTGERLAAGQRGAGVVFQEPRLFPHLRVVDNVAYGLRCRGVGRTAARRQARAGLERLGVGDLAFRRPGALSGGEAQRVALARALAPDPSLLLLDEPLTGLDVNARGTARALLRTTLERTPVPRLLVTHDPLEALALAGRIVILEAGRVVQVGSVADLLLRPRSSFAASLAGLNLVPGRLRRRDGQVAVVGALGTLTVADAEGLDGASVMATVHPTAVSLHSEPPHSSARNALPATVADVELAGDRARVRLDARPPLVAEVTAAALVDLRLAVGTRVWATVKATEIRVDPA